MIWNLVYFFFIKAISDIFTPLCVKTPSFISTLFTSFRKLLISSLYFDFREISSFFETLINKFLKKDSVKHYPSTGDATLSGVIVDCDLETGLAKKIDSFIFGGQLNKTY